jgi:hypothetical protein
VINNFRPNIPFKAVTKEMRLFKTGLSHVCGVHSGPTALPQSDGLHFSDKERNSSRHFPRTHLFCVLHLSVS